MKNKVILAIDSTRLDETTIDLVIGADHHPLVNSDKQFKSQVILPMIEKLLCQYNLTIGDIDEIRVNPGPGSFTGTRVGFSIAQALAKLLGKPVNNVKSESLPPPLYGDSKYE